MDTIYGRNLQEARRLWFAGSDVGGADITFSVNATATFQLPLGLVPGLGEYRVLGVHVRADAVPNDADGTLLFNLDVRDVSEGAWDSIVGDEDLDTLVDEAHKWFEATLEDETSENERTLEPGDTFRVQLVNNSAGIDTNASLAVCIEVIPIPRNQSDEDEDPSHVAHRSEYL